MKTFFARLGFVAALFASPLLFGQAAPTGGVPVRIWAKSQAGYTVTSGLGLYSTTVPPRFYDYSTGQFYDYVNGRMTYLTCVNQNGSTLVYCYLYPTVYVAYGILQLSGTFMPETPGSTGGGAVTAAAMGLQTGQLVAAHMGSNGMVYAEPGKMYIVSVTRSNVSGGYFSVSAPPNYRVILNGMERNQCELSSFATITILPKNDGPPGAAGFASTVGGSRIDWSVALGGLHNGDSAGVLKLVDSGTMPSWTSLYTPAALNCESVSDEVFVYRENNAIRQVFSNQVFLDIVTLSSTSYEVRCYAPIANSSGSILPLSFSGQLPFVTYRIEKDAGSASANALKFTKEIPIAAGTRREIMTIERTGQWPYFKWKSTGWTKEGEMPLVATSVEGSGTVLNNGAVSDRAEAIAVFGSGTPLKLQRNYSAQSAGEGLVSQTLGTSSSLTTGFTYYNNPATPGNFGFVNSVTTPGGGWEAYEYHDVSIETYYGGRVKRRFRPFGNSPQSATLDTNAGEMTQYEYGPDPFGFNSRPILVTTQVNGVMTAKSATAYDSTATTGLITATKYDYSSQYQYLTTTTQYYSEGLADKFLRGKPYSITQPDGVKKCYAYQWGTFSNGVFTAGASPASWGTSLWSRIAVITGTNNSAAGTAYSSYEGFTIAQVYLVDKKSTLNVTIKNERALVARTESYMWIDNAWVPVGSTDFTYNAAGLLLTQTSSNGAVKSATYDGILKTSETDETGLTTTYSYDAAGRVAASSRPLPTGTDSVATHFAYDALGNVTEEIVGWTANGSGEKLVTTRQYDDAGRLVTENPQGNYGAATHTYDVANRSHTVTRAYGATVVETSNRDGRLYAKTGTSLVPEYHSYGAESDGRSWEQVNVASDVGAARWSKVWKDWLGRPVRNERPGVTNQPSPQPNVVEEQTYDVLAGVSAPGHLLLKSKTGFASTLFQYNELGELKRNGLDYDASVQIEIGGTDRVTDADSYVELYTPPGGTVGYWLRTDTIKYLIANSTTASTMQKVRKRLTGFGSNIVQETQTEDAEGNTTTEKLEVTRSTATTKKIVTRSGVANSMVEESRQGFLVKVTDNALLETNTTYDSLGRKATVTDSRNNTTRFAYLTGTTLVQTTTNAAGNVSALGYDALGRTRWTRDPQNRYTYCEYNARGQLLRQWGDATYPVSYAYNAYGEKIAMRTFRSTAQNFENQTWPLSDDGDAANPNPANWTSGDKTLWEYDAATGVLLTKTDAAGKQVSYTYNERSQIQTREWARLVPTGQTNAGQRVKTTYGYDPASGELLSQTYNDGTPNISYTYGRGGEVRSVSDYTTQGSFVGPHIFSYDSTKPWRLVSEKNGTTPSASGFYGDRVQTRLYYETGVVGRAKGFQVGTVVNPAAELEQTVGYAANARVDTITSSRQSNQISRTFRYAYRTDSSLLESLAIDQGAGPGGHPFTVTRTYESTRDLLTSIETKWSTTITTSYAYTYDERGQRQTMVQSGDAFANYGEWATSHQYAYNGRAELTNDIGYLGSDPSNANKQLPGRRHEYTYDKIGNRQTSNRSGIDALRDDYSTNSLNQYVSRENNTVPVSGTAAGDQNPMAAVPDQGATRVAVKGQAQRAGRIGQFWADEVLVANNDDAVNPHPWRGQLSFYAYKRATGSEANKYNTATQWAEIPGAIQRFEYDDDGNLTKDGAWKYIWDAENRLIEMSTDPFALAGAAPLRNRQLVFRYDYLNRRVHKRVFENGSTTNSTGYRYVYDGWNLIAQYAETNTGDLDALKCSYAWGLDIVRSLADAAGVGALLQLTDHSSGKTFLPAYDGNANVAGLLNASTGVIAACYEYSPYGELLRSEAADSVVGEQPFRFSTKYWDAETGLSYYGRRYYSPSHGSFMGRDPKQEVAGLHLYAFVTNNPIDRWDYLGMEYPIVKKYREGGYDRTHPFYMPPGLLAALNAPGKPAYDSSPNLGSAVWEITDVTKLLSSTQLGKGLMNTIETKGITIQLKELDGDDAQAKWAADENVIYLDPKKIKDLEDAVLKLAHEGFHAGEAKQRIEYREEAFESEHRAADVEYLVYQQLSSNKTFHKMDVQEGWRKLTVAGRSDLIWEKYYEMYKHMPSNGSGPSRGLPQMPAPPDL